MFTDWYYELKQIIVDASKHKANGKAYYYVPKSDNSNFNKLAIKINNEMELDIKKINEHLQRGKNLELLNPFGNNVEKIEPVKTNNLDFLYEIEVKINVKKEILASSDIKEVKLEKIKIEAIGSYAKEKLDKIASLQTEITQLYDKLNNFWVTGSTTWSDGGPSWQVTNLKFDFAKNNDYVDAVQDFELTELVINYRFAYTLFDGTSVEPDSTWYRWADSISLSKITKGQKMLIAEAFKKNKYLSYEIVVTYDRYTVRSKVRVVTPSGSEILTFDQEGMYRVPNVMTHAVRKAWVHDSKSSIKWKHRTNLDLNNFTGQAYEKKLQVAELNKEIEYIENNFSIKK